jgi:hypothetical protein
VQLATTHVRDLGGEVLAMEGAQPTKEHLVEPECEDRGDPVRVVIDDGVASTTTVLRIVCQSQPSSRATAFSFRANLSTCSVTQRPARDVIFTRARAMRPSTSVHVATGHDGSRHPNRRLCQASQVGRPEQGRSKSSPRGAQGTSSAPSTSTSSKPTTISHMSVGSVPTGLSHLKSSNNLRYAATPYPPADSLPEECLPDSGQI